MSQRHSSAPRSNEDRSRTTRARLVRAGRASFAERGYPATTLAQVAAAAGVSTGALYHHWTGKEELLIDVLADIHRDLAGEIRGEIAGENGGRSGAGGTAGHSADPLAALERSAAVFLRRCVTPDVGRLLLIEAPAVLGERWHRLDRQWWHRPTATLVRAAGARGLLPVADPDGYATALLGSLTALGREVAAGRRTPTDAVAVLRTLFGHGGQ